MQAYEAFGGALAGHLGLLVLVLVASPFLSSGREAATVVSRAPITSFTLVTVFVLATVPFLLAGIVMTALNLPVTTSTFAPLLLYSGLFAVALAGDDLHIHRQRAAALVAIILLVMPPLLDALTRLCRTVGGKPGPCHQLAGGRDGAGGDRGFPRARTGKRLELIVADPVLASQIALASRDRPHVFPNGDRALAPWIKEGDLRAKGGVVVWPIITRKLRPAREPCREPADLCAGGADHAVLVAAGPVGARSSRLGDHSAAR